jgi:predicted nucleic acid-binding protein
MKTPKYVFDTNVFINMQRHHPADIFGSLWQQVGALIDDNSVVSSEEVLGEIKIGDDYLVDWTKSRKEAFLKSDEKTQRLVRDILSKYAELVTGSKKTNGADPFVIALAKLKNCTLVTDESRSGVGQPPKIPNVCEAYDVRCIKFVEFLRESKIAI